MRSYKAKKYSKALALREKAGSPGSADAQLNCGIIYHNGKGIAKDDTKALYWFEKAAEQGDWNAEECADKLRTKLADS